MLKQSHCPPLSLWSLEWQLKTNIKLHWEFHLSTCTNLLRYDYSCASMTIGIMVAWQSKTGMTIARTMTSLAEYDFLLISRYDNPIWWLYDNWSFLDGMTILSTVEWQSILTQPVWLFKSHTSILLSFTFSFFCHISFFWFNLILNLN